MKPIYWVCPAFNNLNRTHHRTFLIAKRRALKCGFGATIRKLTLHQRTPYGPTYLRVEREWTVAVGAKLHNITYGR